MCGILNGGLTVIDRDAAEADVRKIAFAVDILQDAENKLHTLKRLSESSQGNTAQAISEKAEELQQRVQRMKCALEEAQRYIRNTVQSYERRDAILCQLIEGMRQE